jgi:hypothetical protein
MNQENKAKIIFSKNLLLIGGVIMIITISLFYFYQKQSLKYSVKEIGYDVSEFQRWGCEGLVYSEISENLDLGKETQLKQIVASIDKGTDSVAISIEGDRLKFNTAASLKSGMTDPDYYSIVRNDNKLIAVDIGSHIPGGKIPEVVDVFILDKKTGFAIWTRNSTDRIFTSLPYAFIEYFICR